MGGRTRGFDEAAAESICQAIEEHRGTIGFPSALDKLASESGERWGRQVSARTLRRVWDERRAETCRILHSGNPADIARLAEQQALAARTLAAKSEATSQRAGIALGQLPDPSPIKGRPLSAVQLKEKARAVAGAVLDAALARVQDPGTSARDVGDLVSKVGDLAVSLNQLVIEDDEPT